MELADRELVLPGMQVAEEGRFDLTCFREEGKILSNVTGLYRGNGRQTRVIPSKGPYIPKEGDLVIGIVKLIFDTFWIVDTGSPYRSIILKEEVVKTRDRVNLKEYFDIGDIVSGKVAGVNEVHSNILQRPWKLEKSLIIKVNPKRIPRVVGKNRSMLEIIKQKTGVRIVVGQNGLIWLKGGDINLAVEAIRKIEREAQSRGLTNRITEYLTTKSSSKEGKK